jgi:nicotinate-nucleotide adenylyltransferase
MNVSDLTGAPVGVLGGTFDPVHLAHLALARAARDRLHIPDIRWIPAGQPPHRTDSSTAPRTAAAHRLAMVRAAIAGESGFSLDAAEVNSSAPSYTVHTLQRLRDELGPARPLVLLLGADAFLGLPRWHRWHEVFALAHLAVATRPGFPLDQMDSPLAAAYAARRLPAAGEPAPDRLAAVDFFQGPAGAIHCFELVAGTVSATEVRTRLAAHAPHESLLGLLPAPVLDYIQNNHLYAT